MYKLCIKETFKLILFPKKERLIRHYGEMK